MDEDINALKKKLQASALRNMQENPRKTHDNNSSLMKSLLGANLQGQLLNKKLQMQV